MSNHKRDSTVDNAQSKLLGRLLAEKRERLSVSLFRESIFRQSSLQFDRDSPRSDQFCFIQADD